MEEMKGNPQLAEEYENIFDSEEKIQMAVKVSKKEFTIDVGVVDFEDIIVPDPIKKSRKETYLGLATSVAEMGILQPIHVMISEGFSDWVEEGGNSDDYDGPKYILIDGFRRIWAGFKAGLTRSNAVIWDFKDKDKGVDLSLVLTRLLNKNQDNSWMEKWYLYQLLESQSALTPGTLEYLLQLHSGDAMKLKDIMTCSYQEVKDDLISNKKSLDQAYNMLQKLRKEEDNLAIEDNIGIGDIEQAEDFVEDSGDNKLSDDEISKILEVGDDDFELQADDFDEMLTNNEAEVQDVHDRHPLDPALKAESMMKDNYTCVCCGAGGDSLPMRYKMAILQSHHKVSVANGGEDSVDNLVTVCVTCHTLIHVLEWNKLKFGMGKESYDALPDDEKSRLRKVMEIARLDWTAGKAKGKGDEELKQRGNGGRSTFKMPGTDMNQNAAAYKAYMQSHSEEKAI